MRPTLHALIASALFATIALGTTPASAQEAPPPAPVYAPPPTGYVAPPAPVYAPPPTGYTAPLYQQTQPTYVPQSVAMSGPRLITDWEGGEVPPGYHLDTRIRKGMVIAGATLFGSMYLFSALGAAAGADGANGGPNPEGFLWIPGIGPFMQMASTSSAVGNVCLAVDGLSQTAGLAMLIYGLASPKTVLVRNDLGSLKITPTPMTFGRSGSGLGLVGTF